MKEQAKKKKVGPLPEKILKLEIGVVRRADLITRKVGFDLGIYDPETQNVYILNATAAAVWDHLTPNRSYLDISNALALSFGGDREDSVEIAGDVYSIVTLWKNENLLVDPQDETYADRQQADPPEIYFPDREVSRIAAHYQRPTFKTFTVEELKERFKLEEFQVPVAFADVWI